MRFQAPIKLDDLGVPLLLETPMSTSLPIGSGPLKFLDTISHHLGVEGLAFGNRLLLLVIRNLSSETTGKLQIKDFPTPNSNKC